MASCYTETAAAERACERRRLGLTLHDRQREVVVKFVRGRDVFVSLPNCKRQESLLSVFPGRLTSLEELESRRDRSIVVVVTLLISLMKYVGLELQVRIQ